VPPPPPPDLTGCRVFISYPRGGLAHTWAERVHDDLRARGARVWRDEADVAQGDPDWLARIEEGLTRADLVACIVGPESEGCRWQQREMLWADRVALPVVAARTAEVDLPFYLIEKQPVELRETDEGASALDSLALALARAMTSSRHTAMPRSEAGEAHPTAGTAKRQRELAYLADLLHGDLSTHEARYEPVSGLERRAPSLARSHKGLRMEAGLVLRAFGQSDRHKTQEVPRAFDDVLDAYRELPQRTIRRLAVLGEPGAGKSFSLERIACDHARRASRDPAAPIPILVKLGLWTREAESLEAFLARQLGDVGRDLDALRDAGRAILLLDGLNEIPPAQRQRKAGEIRRLAEDERFAAVVVSCRERDFTSDFALPFDTLTLQPLTPMQIHRFLHRAYALDRGPEEGARMAEARFWEIAGGAALREIWEIWRDAGASFELFWTAEDVPSESPNVYSRTSGQQDQCWREARHGARSLVRLAANPFLLSVLALLPTVPRNRAQLFDGFLEVLYDRERQAREARHDARTVPAVSDWHAALGALAEALQHLQPGAETDAGAATSLPRARWPAPMTFAMLAFSIDASVVQLVGDDLRFTHQLLQEALASRVLLEAAEGDSRSAADFWPTDRWWQRNGWEVVAEIAVEACADDAAALWRLLAWLAQAQPEVACEVWRHAGAPPLPVELAAAIQRQWLPHLTDATAEPAPVARAAIGRALCGFDLDDRPGVGLRSDGLPDINWVCIAGDQPFVYQDGERLTLPTFEIARYPVTNRQFQAFVDAGGYAEDRWWVDLARRFDDPARPNWSDPNAPRETVCWYEAVAYCRWLSHALRCEIRLPTEQQWERVARGTDGSEYPWVGDVRAGLANFDEVDSDIEGGTYIGRTTAVGIYPVESADGVKDLAGNVWEWCLNEFGEPESIDTHGDASRVLRGGSWCVYAGDVRAADRFGGDAVKRDSLIGFRVCRGSPIE
jgi:hypothetical protein